MSTSTGRVRTVSTCPQAAAYILKKYTTRGKKTQDNEADFYGKQRELSNSVCKRSHTRSGAPWYMDERISHYIKELLPEIRPPVLELRNQNANNLHLDIQNVVDVAKSEGDTYRARFTNHRVMKSVIKPINRQLRGSGIVNFTDREASRTKRPEVERPMVLTGSSGTVFIELDCNNLDSQNTFASNGVHSVTDTQPFNFLIANCNPDPVKLKPVITLVLVRSVSATMLLTEEPLESIVGISTGQKVNYSSTS